MLARFAEDLPQLCARGVAERNSSTAILLFYAYLVYFGYWVPAAHFWGHYVLLESQRSILTADSQDVVKRIYPTLVIEPTSRD